jgi:glycosyltransferase involved in cell wall biosynthesis
MPLISVILPARNADKFVSRAITSTLRALPRDSELVVIDDGSSDRTLEFAQRIADPRLRIIEHVTSRGLASSLNEAIGLTDSKFVARMDADDITLPWRFRTQIKQIEDGGLEAVFGAVLYMRSNGVVTRPDSPGHLNTRALGLSLLVGNSLVHPTLFARRDALDRSGPYRDVRAEDYELWMRLFNAGARMARAAVPMIVYRKHGGQISSSESWQQALASEAADGAIPDGHRELFQRLLGTESWHPQYLEASLRLRATRASLNLISPLRRVIRESSLTLTERLYVSGRVSSYRRFCLSAAER